MIKIKDIRSRLIAVLPSPIRSALRALVHYAQRLFRWGVILVEVRGLTWRDEIRLWMSAVVGVVDALRDIQVWRDPVAILDMSVRVRGVGEFAVRRSTDDLWHVLPWRERKVVSNLVTQLRTGEVFVDAGANIGFYTVLAGHLVGPSGRVIAIEMMPDTAKILRAHIRQNGLENVYVVEKALSSEEGRTTLARVTPGQHGQASIAIKHDRPGREVPVETTTLATLLSGIEQIALIKMDLEGAERIALAGAGGTLSRVRAVIFEDWGDASLTELFRHKGFRVERLDGNNCIASNIQRQ